MEGPRFLEPGEFKQIDELLTTCFGGGPPTEVEAWPHVCRPQPEFRDRYQVMSDNGRIIGSVGIVPMEFFLDGAVLPVGGISIVATHPDYRHRGVATALIRSSIELMKERGFALSWLNGNRQLYSRFGWERAGRKYNFRFDRRSIAGLPALSHEIHPYRGEDRLATAIATLYRQRPLRGVRDRDLTRLLLSRAGTDTYLAMNGRDVAGYLCVTPDPRNPTTTEVYEYGGDPVAVGDLLRFCFDELSVERLAVASPCAPDPSRPLMLEHACEWNLGFSGWVGSGGMINILDLPAMLEAFVPQFTRRLGDVGITDFAPVTLKITGTRNVATIHPDGNGGAYVTRDAGVSAIELSPTEMVRALFGLDEARLTPDTPAALRAVTPLDFYVSPMEMV